MQDLGGVGQVLAGRYRVEYVLGRGGMGVVVAALDLESGQRVALKFLLPATLSRADAVPRFLREARAAARLASEHVARVSDVGTLEWGAPYIVMELLTGSDLHRVVKVHGPLPLAEAVEYVRQACEAIAEAHALGIVHRDLKSENLFLTQLADGSPWIKVLDFGISKAPIGELADGAVTSMTRTDMVMGSPQYMSPEQLRSSKDVDARADVWSLGVVLYELATGAFPFEGETLVDLMSQIIGAAPIPPRSRRAEMPVELERIILRCLEKDLPQRFASAADLSSALASVLPALSASGGGALIRTLQTSVSATPAPWQAEANDEVPARIQTASAWDRSAPKGAKHPGKLLAAAAALAAIVGLAIVLVRSAAPDADSRAEPSISAARHAATPAAPALPTASAPDAASAALRAASSPAAASAVAASASPSANVANAANAATARGRREKPALLAAPATSAPPVPPSSAGRPRRPAPDVFSKRKW